MALKGKPISLTEMGFFVFGPIPSQGRGLSPRVDYEMAKCTPLVYTRKRRD